MKNYMIWGWDGGSHLDAAFFIEAVSSQIAAESFMKTYPFNPKFWKPHRLLLCETLTFEEVEEKARDSPFAAGRSHRQGPVEEFEVASLEPLVVTLKTA